MEATRFVTPEFIRSQVLTAVDDEALQKGYTKGFYDTVIYEAVRELEFDAYLATLTEDVYNWYEEGKQKVVDLPCGAFNVKEVYLFNGNEFTIEDSTALLFKNRFNNDNKTSGFTAKLKRNGRVLPAGRGYYDAYVDNALYYGNIQNGVLMLGDECISYKHVRFVYSGTTNKIGECPIIPEFISIAVRDYCIEYALRNQKIRNPSLRSHWADAVNTLTGSGRGRNRGTWGEAKIRCQTMQQWERDNLIEYFKRGNW